MIVASQKEGGKYSYIKHKLKNIHRTTCNLCPPFKKDSMHSPSGPADLPFFCLFVAAATSLMVIFSKVSAAVVCTLCSKANLCCVSLTELYTSWKWFLHISANAKLPVAPPTLATWLVAFLLLILCTLFQNFLESPLYKSSTHLSALICSMWFLQYICFQI